MANGVSASAIQHYCNTNKEFDLSSRDARQHRFCHPANQCTTCNKINAFWRGIGLHKFDAHVRMTLRTRLVKT